MSRLSTDFFTASGSLMVGMGSIWNLPGHYFWYNSAPTPEIADARAIWNDFAMVGQDIADAMAAKDRLKKAA